MTRSRTIVAVAAALAAGVAHGPMPQAAASDAKAFATLEATYEKLARNHDDEANLERRKLLLRTFDYLDLKACRKLLRGAYDDEQFSDQRIAAVQVLAASGDPKDLDFLVTAFKKEKARGPVIACGEGLGYTAEELVPAAAAWIAKALPKSKGDLRLSLLEALGELRDPSAYDAVLALGDKLPREEQFERTIALGACGREKALPALVQQAGHADANLRFAATLALVRAGGTGALDTMVELVGDRDSRIAEAAARFVGEAKHAPATAKLVDALAPSPLRARAAIRDALVAITGKDFGFDASAWRAHLDGKTPATTVPAPLPEFFGIPVASDRVLVLLDISGSMDWSGRLPRMRDGAKAFVDRLQDTSMFDLWTVCRVTESFSGGMAAGPDARARAADWIAARLTGSGFDLAKALDQVLKERPDVDTILLATDSYPWGESGFDTPLETILRFRRANRMRRLRVHVAFVVPGGRYVASEPHESIFEDRALVLTILAEQADGKFVRVAE